MKPETKRQQIRDRLIGAQNKKALLVEGADDEKAFRIFLNNFCGDWESRWVLAVADGKVTLLKILELERDWLGVVDHDEWDDSTIAANTASNPNLWVLPRFCFENYLILPDDLWVAIPTERQSLVAGGLPAFSREIEADLSKYLRHGVLWKVISPLWSGLRARGFKEALASDGSIENAQNDTEIRRFLGEWSALLDPEPLFALFQDRLRQANSQHRTLQLSQWVHGKIFWSFVVNPVLNRTFVQMSDEEWRKQILLRLPKPTDLQPLFDRLC